MSRKRIIVVTGGLMLGMLLGALDQTIVGPVIRRKFIKP